MQVKYENDWWDATPEWQAPGLFFRYPAAEGYKPTKQTISREYLGELIEKKKIKGDVGEIEELCASYAEHAKPPSLPLRCSGKASPSLSSAPPLF